MLDEIRCDDVVSIYNRVSGVSDREEDVSEWSSNLINSLIRSGATTTPTTTTPTITTTFTTTTTTTRQSNVCYYTNSY